MKKRPAGSRTTLHELQIKPNAESRAYSAAAQAAALDKQIDVIQRSILATKRVMQARMDLAIEMDAHLIPNRAFSEHVNLAKAENDLQEIQLEVAEKQLADLIEARKQFAVT